MKKMLAVVLALSLCIGVAPMAFAGGLHFTDVPSGAWYYDDLQTAYTEGLINGKTATEFKPNDNMTYAEAIKLAACLHQRDKEGSVSIENGNPWYRPYVDYCMENDIISKFAEYDYNAPATRAEYMNIFAHALPAEKLEAINDVPMDSIPDYHGGNSFAKEVYLMYRAGIVGGVDAEHNCKPNTNIKRSEVATILSRMMFAEKRIKFTMGAEIPKTEELLVEIPKDAEILPAVPEEPTVEIKEETSDMYEPFEITVQPEMIDSADEGDTLTYTVKASGGKTPYTYSWGTRDRYNGFTEFTESKYVKGAKTNTLSLVFDLDNSTTSQFYCKITDALGQEVKSESLTIPEKVFIFKPESFTKEGNGYTFVGRVEKGAVRVGETVSMHMPDKGIEVYGVVSKIIMFNKNLDEAKQGDYCGIFIEESKNIPYDMWVVETLGLSLTERVKGLGNYGFKVPMKLTFQYGGIKNLGETVTMSMHVKGGTPPYTYEWYKFEKGKEYTKIVNDHKYSVMGSEVRIIVDADEFAQNMWYRCDVTDAAGNTQYETWYGVEPEATPYLSQQPKDVYADYGEEVVFNVHTRCATATYQWYIKNDNTNGWKKIEKTDTWAKGATTKTLKIQVEKADFVSHCEYRCDVKNGTYGIVSNAAKILPKSMYITADPQTVAGKHGEKVQFKVVAEGGKGPYNYQWEFTYPSDVLDGGYLKVYKDYEWAEGENTDTLTVLVDGNKMNSDCKFRCTVTDATGRKLTSKEAYIIITADANVSFEKSSTKDETIVLMD